jgi:hypothetical protein
MRFPLIAVGNSNNMVLEASKSAVLGFGKRAAREGLASKAQALLAERTAPQILAITVPLAAALASMAWAIATYLMVRERYRAQVELARLEIEANKQGISSKEPALMRVDDRAMGEHPVH